MTVTARQTSSRHYPETIMTELDRMAFHCWNILSVSKSIMWIWNGTSGLAWDGPLWCWRYYWYHVFQLRWCAWNHQISADLCHPFMLLSALIVWPVCDLTATISESPDESQMWDKLLSANNLAPDLSSSLILCSPSKPIPQVAAEQTAFSSRRVSSFTLLTCSAVSWELCGLRNKAAHTSPLGVIRFLSVQGPALKQRPPTARAAARSLQRLYSRVRLRCGGSSSL